MNFVCLGQGKNKAKTNPIKANSKPILGKTNPIQTQNKANYKGSIQNTVASSQQKE
jgi:hypothetical protein